MNQDKLFIFDIDGTLTEPRQQIDGKYYGIFISFILNNVVHLVTGSDYPKAKEQLDGFILENVHGVFTCMGNTCHRGTNIIYNNLVEFDETLVNALENIRKNSKYPYQKFDNYIEKRSGMINFSTLGREADIENRKKYNNWDKINKEREIIVNSLSKYYPNYDFVIGGEISIDIFQKSKDKAQILNHLNVYPEKCTSMDVLYSDVVFFGDKICENGNDYSLAMEIEKNGGTIHKVCGPEDTFKIIYDKYL